METSESTNFGKIGKVRSSYGSVNKSSHSNDTFLKYNVKSGDTIQGIALKFGVSMDVIKRANQLWTNDSLFLRDYILIPIQGQNKGSTGSIHENSQSQTTSYINGANSFENGDAPSESVSYEVITRQDLLRKNKNIPRSKSCMNSLTNGRIHLEDYSEGEKEASAKDFLSKFDVTVARIKQSVENLDAKSNFPEDDTNPLNLLPKRRSATLSRRTLQGTNNTDDNFTIDIQIAPQLAFVTGGTIGNSSRHLQTSNERLQRASEELFQL